MTAILHSDVFSRDKVSIKSESGCGWKEINCTIIFGVFYLEITQRSVQAFKEPVKSLDLTIQERLKNNLRLEYRQSILVPRFPLNPLRHPQLS